MKKNHQQKTDAKSRILSDIEEVETYTHPRSWPHWSMGQVGRRPQIQAGEGVWQHSHNNHTPSHGRQPQRGYAKPLLNHARGYPRAWFSNDFAYPRCRCLP